MKHILMRHSKVFGVHYNVNFDDYNEIVAELYVMVGRKKLSLSWAPGYKLVDFYTDDKNRLYMTVRPLTADD